MHACSPVKYAFIGMLSMQGIDTGKQIYLPALLRHPCEPAQLPCIYALIHSTDFDKPVISASVTPANRC